MPGKHDDAGGKQYGNDLRGYPRGTSWMSLLMIEPDRKDEAEHDRIKPP
jgi:hypothetical protein